MTIELNNLVTESTNTATSAIDTLSTIDMLRLINQEDKKVAQAVELQLPNIASAVDLISNAFLNNGRLIYLGAGTSGRLGILDASECPPTFGLASEKVIGLIAGGDKAVFHAVENAEDDITSAKHSLQDIKLTAQDVVVGIAASGRTPYVIGGMHYAKSIGANVIAIVCDPNSPMLAKADIGICLVVGPEVITGSSRMKAGTAQKMVLNMLSSGTMIKVGKVYGNLMVDVQATNAKLIQRQINIVVQATGASQLVAQEALNACEKHCKTAILMILLNIDATKAKQKLLKHNGFIRAALHQ